MVVDSRSDIFSLGILFSEMLTGRTPFVGDTNVSMMSAILKDVPTSVTDVRIELPNHLGRIVRRCLQKDPERRYQTAKDIVNELEGLRLELAEDSDSGTQRGAREPREAAFGWPPRRWLVAAGVAAVTVSVGWIGLRLLAGAGAGSPAIRAPGGVESIVALPTDVIGVPELDYLADAIPRSLSAQLTGMSDLDVKLPPRSIELELSGRDLDDLTRAYGTDTLVTSSLTAAGSDLLLEVRLIQRADQQVLWEREFPGQAEAPFEVVNRAAAAVREAVRPGQLEVMSVTGATASSPAEVEIRKGQYVSNRYTILREPGDFDLALAAFERALELDSRSAAAAVEIANLYIFRLEGGDMGALANVESWSDRAIELDPRSSGGWGVRSYVEGRRLHPDHAGRLEAALKALTYGPNDPRAHEFVASALNESELSGVLAGRAFTEAARLDPLYLMPRLAEAGILIGLGRGPEASLLIDRVLELEPGMPVALLMRSWVLSVMNRVEEAARVAQEVGRYVEEGRIEAESYALSTAIQALDRNDLDAFLPLYEPIPQLAVDPEVPHWVKRYAVVMVFELARHGQSERSLDLMELFADADPGLIPGYDGLVLSPVYDGLRDEPRFQTMLSRSRARWDETVALFAAARERGEMPAYLDRELEDLVAQLDMMAR